MPNPNRVTVAFERRLLEHPRAYHFRRMRLALWLYLDLLLRLPAHADTLEVAPALVASDMGLPEGTVRSWLGHLRRLGYLSIDRRNGTFKLRLTRLAAPEPPAKPKPRFFTVAKLERALGQEADPKVLQESLQYPDEVVKRALAGALAVPEAQIRKSRTALFRYLLTRYAYEPPTDPRP